MNEARDAILNRIRTALRDVPPGERPSDVSVARAYRRWAEADVALLTQRIREYNADVWQVPGSQVASVAGEVCARMGLRRVVVPPALSRDWWPDGVEIVIDDGLSALRLDEVDGAITGCMVAIAQTGTLLLNGEGESGRRLITLVPDHHICVVRAEQVVGLVPEAIAALAEPVRERHVPVTLVSGPSASSDIELSRIEGIHGPRYLGVIIAR